MPWNVSCPMDERMVFVAACLAGEVSIVAACAGHGISRKTGQKWLKRYRAEGAAGLRPLSSARHTQAQAIAPALAEQLIAMRRLHPTWGPRKLLGRLALDAASCGPPAGEPAAGTGDAARLPAASTVGDLLHREGLSTPRHRRAPVSGSKAALTPPAAPNDSWSIDFKGWFRTGDGVRFEPLTIADGYSRYLMACKGMARITAACVQPELIRVFQAHGLPRALRSDNGSPFASMQGLAGLTQLSVWLLTLNIWPDRIDPGRPDQNGRHERMHRVLLEDAASPPSATGEAQQKRLDEWREDYNTVRPHEALGQRCPASLYVPSPRAYPAQIAAWDYPADHHARPVNSKGYIKWRSTEIYLSEALGGQVVALAQADDGDWTVRFRQFCLAMLSDQTNRIRPSRLARVAAYVPAAPALVHPA